MVFVHLHLSPFSPPLSTFFRSRSLQVSPACPNRSPTLVSCVLQSQMENDVAKGKFYEKSVERDEIPLGLPGKGRTASDTLDLLKISNMQVWFQRPKDIIRKLISGDLDLGIVGLDTFSEYGEENEDLIIVHDDLDYGHCHLSLAIPKYGIFENINSVKELAQMPQWTEERPLRVATEFTYLGPKFVKENGLKDVSFSTADGGLEATPAMGIADAILDLVSSGKTLKKIEGGGVLEIQAVLVASRRALTERKDALETTHEILERLEAHFRAVNQFTVTANMRGTSAEEVAERVQSQPSLSGLQGLTISPVFCQRNGKYQLTIMLYLFVSQKRRCTSLLSNLERLVVLAC